MAASVEGRISLLVMMLIGGELCWKCHWREAGALEIGIVLHLSVTAGSKNSNVLMKENLKKL